MNLGCAGGDTGRHTAPLYLFHCLFRKHRTWQRHLPGMMSAVQYCPSAVHFFPVRVTQLEFFPYISNCINLINMTKYTLHGLIGVYWKALVPVHENLLFDLSGMTNPQYTTTVTLTKHKVKLYCSFYENHDA